MKLCIVRKIEKKNNVLVLWNTQLYDSLCVNIQRYRVYKLCVCVIVKKLFK